MSNPPIIVDTNIIFSALLNDNSEIANKLLKTEDKFYICEMTLTELFKHKEKILKLTRLSEAEMIDFYHFLIGKLYVFKESDISLQNWLIAYQLCKVVDENDTPHVALTLELNGLLWTSDKKLKSELSKLNFQHFF